MAKKNYWNSYERVDIPAVEPQPPPRLTAEPTDLAPSIMSAVAALPKALGAGLVNTAAHKYVGSSSWKRAGIAGGVLAGSSYVSGTAVTFIPDSIRGALGSLEADFAASLISAAVMALAFRKKKAKGGPAPGMAKQFGTEFLYSLGSCVVGGYIAAPIASVIG